jgi:hypothetical protein
LDRVKFTDLQEFNELLDRVVDSMNHEYSRTTGFQPILLFHGTYHHEYHSDKAEVLKELKPDPTKDELECIREKAAARMALQGAKVVARSIAKIVGNYGSFEKVVFRVNEVVMVKPFNLSKKTLGPKWQYLARVKGIIGDNYSLEWITDGPTRTELAGSSSSRHYTAKYLRRIPPGCQEADVKKLMSAHRGQVFRFECLLAKRIVDDRWQYLIFWKGYKLTEATWEFATEIFSDVVADRHDALTDLTGRSDESVNRELELLHHFLISEGQVKKKIIGNKKRKSTLNRDVEIDSDSDDDSDSESDGDFDASLEKGPIESFEIRANQIEDLILQYSLSNANYSKASSCPRPRKPMKDVAKTISKPLGDGTSYRQGGSKQVKASPNLR